jgi:hypothetical protein
LFHVEQRYELDTGPVLGLGSTRLLSVPACTAPKRKQSKTSINIDNHRPSNEGWPFLLVGVKKGRTPKANPPEGRPEESDPGTKPDERQSQDRGHPESEGQHEAGEGIRLCPT